MDVVVDSNILFSALISGKSVYLDIFRVVHYMPDQTIVATLSQQLSWSHFIEFIKIEDKLKREFYLQLCADGHWSVRTLRGRIDKYVV